LFGPQSLFCGPLSKRRLDFPSLNLHISEPSPLVVTPRVLTLIVSSRWSSLMSFFSRRRPLSLTPRGSAWPTSTLPPQESRILAPLKESGQAENVRERRLVARRPLQRAPRKPTLKRQILWAGDRCPIAPRLPRQTAEERVRWETLARTLRCSASMPWQR